MTLVRRWLPSWWLIAWLWRQQLTVTLIAVALAGSFAVLWPDRLYWPVIGAEAGLFVMLFVVIHSVAMVVAQGRPGSGTFAYLYTRGFSRDRLWLHQMLASTAAVLTVALAVVVVTWTPLRAMYQDVVRQSPFYPGAAMLEGDFQLRPLLAYALLLPPLHYVWIRLAQPMRGGLAGLFLAGGPLLAGLLAMFSGGSTGEMMVVLMAVLALLLTAWGWRLHRQLEVTR